MTHIRDKSIEGRPVFRAADKIALERPTESSLKQNPLLKRLKPSKNPSSIPPFFRRMWASLTKFFSVKHPDIIKENFGSLVRPLDTGVLPSFMTVGNLFHHYEHFLREDSDCPPGVKKCFDRMEHDEKEIVKIERMKEGQTENREKFVRKTVKSVKRMTPGKSRLFLLQRGFSQDSSVSGDLFCTINRKEGGYTVNFLGSAARMRELTGEDPLAVAGKEKVQRSLTFEIDVDTFEASPFLDTLINQWAKPQGVKSHEILSATEQFAKTSPTSLDDYMTSANRPDKLFWNIIGSMPKETENVSRASVRSIRLRAELLTLYEAFDEIRISLNPKNKRYREFKKLFEDVSGKVLLNYRKEYLSAGDFEAIKRKLMVIDGTLIKAEQKTARAIPSKISVENPKFEGVSLKRAGIQAPLQTTDVPGDFTGSIASLDQIGQSKVDIALDSPLSLDPYPAIDIPGEFLTKLEEFHALCSILQNGTIEERNWALNEVFRFFKAVPLNDLTENGDINPNSVWLKFSSDESRDAMQKIVDLTEAVATIKTVEEITQYDYAAILKMRDIVLVLNTHRTGHWICGAPFISMSRGEEERRDLTVGKREENHSSRFLNNFPKYNGNPDLMVGEATRFFHTPKKAFFADVVELPHEEYDLVFQQQYALMDIFSIAATDNIRSRYIQKGFSWDLWLRPVHNPYLSGLYRNAQTGITEYSYIEQEAPEAFFDNPEEMFEYFKAKTKDSASLPGSDLELKMLSRLLSKTTIKEEFSAFIVESSHLLYNPEIRNFFDALLFRLSDLNEIEQDIRKAIQKTTNEIEKELAKPRITDPELQKNRFETILYYYETLIRIGINVQPAELEALCDQCRAIPELNGSLGYASRVLLRQHLSEKSIAPEKLGEILNTFADVKTAYMDPMNVEPQFEQELQLAWQLIAEQLNPTDGEQFKPLLDRVCVNQGIPLDASPWRHEGNLIFRNDHHQVDLKNWEASSPYMPVYMGRLPQEVLQDPFMKKLLAKEEVHGLTVRVEGEIYSFTDARGIRTQIEERDGKYSLYKQFAIDGTPTWLQSLDTTPKLKAKEKDTGLLAAYGEFKKRLATEESGSIELAFLQNGIYVDPLKASKGYVLDATGSKLDFEIKLKQDGKNLQVEKFTDYRESPHRGPWQICSGAALEDKSFDFLKTFENKNELLLYSKKGRLKKVEMPRYGLMFAVKDGKLFCETGAMAGFHINPEADTFGFSNALVLEHPDPSKGKKLLLPDADAMKMKIKRVEPKAKGFGKIALFFHYIDVVSKMMEGIFPSIVTRQETYFDPNKSNLSYTTVNLRAHTEEICQSKNWPQDLLQLMKHASKQPQLALSFFDQFPQKEALTDPKLLKGLIQFTDGGFQATGNEAAFKLKVAISLQKFLKGHNRLKKLVQDRLEQNILSNGKQVLQAGRRVSLHLTTDEQMELSSLLKEKDPDFYAKHMIPHLVPEGSEIDFQAPDTTLADTAVQTWKSEHPIETSEQRIKGLEDKIHPKVPLTNLSVSINRLETPERLLFTPEKVAKLFDSGKATLTPINLPRSDQEKPYETVALEAFQESLNTYSAAESERTHHTLKRGKRRLQNFIDDKLLPKQEAYEDTMARIENKIEKAFRKSTNAETQVAILSGQEKRPSFSDLRLALIQGTLPELIPDLENDLITYFDALARRNIIAASIALMEKMKAQKGKDPKNWQLMSDDLHRLLTLERKYDPKANPRLLVFEAQTAKNFKDLPGGLNQLDLLESLISDPSTLVQAPTGAGKTAVLSVLESLLKSTGENLVIQKVLPPLYNQTYDQTNQVVGDLFNTLLMPLRFNLKMRLTNNEIHFEEGEEKTKPTSIFKGMYEDLCQVIQNKGCVLTDYSSLPMMEAKYLQIGQQLVECSMQGVEPTDIQKEHYKYLKKILILVRNKGLQSMDEFDQPNRPIQKLQLDMQSGSKEIPEFFFETTLEIYHHLANDEELGLTRNLQFEVTDETRAKARERAALAMAESLVPALKEGLYDYFLGVNEDVLTHLNDLPPKILDKIAVCQKQFTIYLPLTLNSKEGSRYKRSLDGSKTVPCFKGERHENSKQGTLFEQMNYIIQDYKQTGVTHYDLNAWFNLFKKEWDQDGNDLEFKAIFPNHTVPEVAALLKAKDPSLVTQVNETPDKVNKFLKIRLESIKSSGYLISLDPVNNVDMSLAAGGISATSGAPESLHDQFKQDAKVVGQIKAGMAYRMLTRAADPNTVISYDPEHPEELFAKASKPLHAVIDGAGAFASTQDAAARLLASSPALKQVGYHEEDGTLSFVGVPTGSLAKTGVFFNEAHTRGTDIALTQNAHALLVINAGEGFRGLSQEEGRMRQEGQTVDVAMPETQALANLTEVITKGECIDALQDAKDIYRGACQKIRAQARNAMMKRLLACKNRKEFVALFQNEDCNSLFITKPEKTYAKPGEYFAKNRHIQKEDVKPEDALNALFADYQEKAERLGVDLIQPVYSPELLAKMPPLVSPVTADLEAELQVEAEQDVEVDVDMDLELDQNVEVQQEVEEEQSASKAGLFYPPRISQNKTHSVAAYIHPAYDPRLRVTESFLPFERNTTQSQYKRYPFERSMFNIGEIYVQTDVVGNIQSATIEDPLRDHALALDIYDIRLNRSVLGLPILRTPEFYTLVSQSKFLDGRTSGYSPKELAALEEWLIASGPAEMKRHMLEDVLRFRYREKQHFERSQLGELFRRLS